ncbi:MAG: ABC transporter substrate-binding protein [Trueperaceae bacterium]|nr:ABC transporter substrate-binding protein [Trueperaceae bacterium]
MIRRSLFVLVLALLAPLALAQPQSGGTLTVGMQADPVGLDPHITNATSTRNMLENVYDTLVAFDSSLQIVPGLAESWEASDDGLTWTFTLREGVTFHDGTPLTASDVAFSLNRITDPDIASPRADDFAVIDSIDTPDDRTVVLNLSEPFSPLLSKLAHTLNVVVSEATVEEHGDLQEVVNGTGPFAFVEYLPQTRMVLERNPDFWGTDADGTALPYLDGITFEFYPDPTSRSTAIQTGSADMVEYVPAADVETLEADPNVEVVGGLSANFRSIYFNVEREPFDDVNVRRAISYAVDEQAVVDLALFGTGGVPATGTTIPSQNYYGIEDDRYVGRDLEAAREALAASDHPDGFSFELYVTSTYDFLRTPAEVIQSNLAEIGIDAEIVAEDWSVYLPKVLEGDYAATILGESGQSDPDDFLFNVFYTDNGGNLGNYSNPELDALLEEGRRVSDQEARREIYAQAQELILDEAPHTFLFHSSQYEALRPEVRGFEHFPNTSYLGLRTTWLDR